MPFFTVRSPLPISAAPPPTYVGPGDVVSGAAVWGGLRAYNAAYATGSNPAIDIVDQTNSNLITVNILANGDLDVATINAWVIAHSVVGISVAKLYDQSGNGRDFVPATFGTSPLLSLTGLNGLPALSFNSANSTLIKSGGVAGVIPPFSYNAVTLANGSGAVSIMIDSNSNVQLARTGAAGQWQEYVGSSILLQNIADGVAHAMAATSAGGGTGSFYIDNFVATGNPGTNTSTTPSIVLGAVGTGGQFLDGFISEARFDTFVLNPTQVAALIANETAYWKISTVLSPGDRAPAVVLSNGNLTGTSSGTTACARSTIDHASGKYYYKWHVDAATSAYDVGVGVANSTANLFQGPGSPDVNSAGYYVGDSNVYAGGSSVGNTGVTMAVGDTGELCLDIGAQFIWVRVNGGNWNGNPSANPSTGVGGFSVSSFAGPYYVVAAYGSTNGQSTFNFLTGSPPSGYTNW